MMKYKHVKIMIGLTALCFTAVTSARQPAAPAGSAVASAKLNGLDQALRDAYAANPHGGFTIGIISNDRVVWTGSYGFADEQARRPAKRDTVYRIGSITKQFTAIAYLRLLQANRLAPDAHVVDIFPALGKVHGDAAKVNAITFDALAGHRSGLAREPRDARFLTGPIDQWETILKEALADTDLAFEPFAEPNYSNIGYGTLGAAISTVAGVPYTDLIEKDILQPLDMRSSGFSPTPSMLQRLARGYERGKDGKSDPSAADRELRDGRGYKIPNGGLFTTVDDLARFVSFEMNGAPKVLPVAVLQKNYTEFHTDSHGAIYGRGFSRLHGLIGHGGSVAGFRAAAYFDPARKLGFICLRNFGDGFCSPALADRVLGYLNAPDGKLDLRQTGK